MKQPRGDVDIGDRADAAQQREQREAADHAEAAIAIGAVGDLVVEQEIARHRDDRRRRSGSRRNSPSRQPSIRPASTSRWTTRPTRRSRRTARSGSAARRRSRDGRRGRENRGRPAATVSIRRPGAGETRRGLDDLQAAAGGQHDVDEDLEAVGRKPRREARDDLAANHEEAAHRIADRDPGHAAEEPGAEVAQLLARRREAARRRLVGDARADRQIAARPRRAPRTFSAGSFRRAADRRRSPRRSRRSTTATPR